jgi:hypothetical protein
MKLQLMWLRAGFLVLVLWACPRQAAAYYDPGVQCWINRDPIAETGDGNLYRFAQNGPLDSVDPQGTTIRRGDDGPPVTPRPEDFKGNCYLYALGCPIGSTGPNGQPVPPRYGIWPGFFADPPQASPNKNTCESLLKRIQSDFKGDPNVKPPPKKGDCPKGYHRIRMEIGKEGWGYHFKRQNPDGSWAEKPSDFENPKPCDRNTPAEEGNTQCPDDVCVPNGSKY